MGKPTSTVFFSQAKSMDWNSKELRVENQKCMVYASS